MNSALLVGLGGAIGAVTRHVVGRVVEQAASDDGDDGDDGTGGRRSPVATFAVNVVGTFALGLLAFAGVGGDAMLLAGVGACGAFTTFSSFAVDAVTTWGSGDRRLAVGYALGTLAGAAAALGAAWALATLLGF